MRWDNALSGSEDSNRKGNRYAIAIYAAPFCNQTNILKNLVPSVMYAISPRIIALKRISVGT